MSKYFQNIQKLYKLKYNKKYYYNNLIRYIYLYKYFICINIYELNVNILKEIKMNSYLLDAHQTSFSSTIIKKVYLKTIFGGLNGHILMYVTNNKDLFFSILKKINLYYLIGYEHFLFYNKFTEEENFISLYNEYHNNYNKINFIIIDFYLINICTIINSLIIKIIFIL
jgi:uncharacterized membrane protein